MQTSKKRENLSKAIYDLGKLSFAAPVFPDINDLLPPNIV